MAETQQLAREYELIYILKPSVSPSEARKVAEKVTEVIDKRGAKLTRVDNWGKRRLAYEVAKERKGIYLYWLYLAQPGVVEETERDRDVPAHPVGQRLAEPAWRATTRARRCS